MRDRCVVAKARITSSKLDSTGSVCISGRGTIISRTWICASSMALKMNFSSPGASNPRSRACRIWIWSSSVECATPCEGMGEELGMRSRSARPDGLKDLRQRGFAECADGQACERNAELHARNHAVQVAQQDLDNPRSCIPLCD